MKELVQLLEKISFAEDNQKDLLLALNELDTDADGFIEMDVLADYMRSVGEPFSDEEMQHFAKVARDETSDRPTLVDIKRLAQILMPKIVTEN